MATDLILGTAGHIDHGKTALVRALTGTDTDRLPEEKRRGITIELGFAQLDLGDVRLGIVDVPGHEKFVRQMLAGATGMDLAMLVVAADDSVKPQTREHMDVLRLLDLPAGVIALTKCDLAEADWIDLVEAEVRELVVDSFLADAPVIRTSAETREGIDQLIEALRQAARQAIAARAPQHDAPFRMAIDRSFTIAGHGTVVTGSVSSGSVQVGDTLVVQPDNIEVRVRGLNNHDLPVDSVHRGQRAAINLAGLHHDALRRGHELAAAGHLQPADLVTVHLQVLPAAVRPLKNRARMRLHVGTAQVLATVALLDADKLEPGQGGVAQLFLRDPVAVVWNQPFVVRSESPVMTIGGGRMLVPQATKIKRLDATEKNALAALQSDDQVQRAAAALLFVGFRPWQPHDLVRLAGCDHPDAVVETLTVRGELVELEVSPQRTARVHREFLRRWHQRILQGLLALHAEQPMRSAITVAQLLSRFQFVGDEALLQAIVRGMAQEKLVRLTARGVAHRDHQLKLSKPQQALLEEIIQRFAAARFKPPTVSEYRAELPKQASDVEKLIQVAVAEEQLVHIGKDMYLHVVAERELRDEVARALADRDGMTLSDIRELLDTTRKYAVPFCEYLDRIGWTRRSGDLRYLAKPMAST